MGRDGREAIWNLLWAGFNPRARVGRDAFELAIVDPPYGFQSTRPRGARQTRQRALLSIMQFQSTRPRGARPLKVLAGSRVCAGFNPRARVGRDEPLPAVRGKGGEVSIHAPAWGATYTSAILLDYRVGFNPRARVGRDAIYYKRFVVTVDVSIHAPAWGATSERGEDKIHPTRFNPRARVGRDL